MKKSILIILGIFTLVALDRANAQKATSLPRIGFIISSGAPTDPAPQWEAFRRRLGELGYLEGKNIVIDRRFAEGKLERMPPFVQEFVQEKVDAIVAVNNIIIRAAKESTKTIPIVMISSLDPVAAGYVESFARPGGNITGLAWLSRDLSAKRLEMLKELLPKVSRVGVLWDADGPGPAIAFKEYSAAAQGFKLDITSLSVRGPNPDITGAFQNAKKANIDAMIVVGNPLIGQRIKQIFELATKNRIPSMAEEGRYVEAGGLISYGASLTDMYSRAAEFVVEILKGAKPSDLPIKLASKFEIRINLKTSQQLGLVVPQHLLVQADKVIK